MDKNEEVDLVWGAIPPKIRIALKKALNKNCWKSNFVQKSPRAHMSIFLCSGTRGLETLPHLKIVHYYFFKVGIKLTGQLLFGFNKRQ